MGFGEAIGSCFSHYAGFGGRARRSEYWYFVLFAVLASIPAAILDKIFFAQGTGSGPVSSILSLALFLPLLAVTVRRLHDTGRSGWWIGGFYLYLAAAVMGSIMVIFGPAGTGTKGPEGTIVPAALMIGAGVYAIWMFVLTILEGTNGPNRYGPDPGAAP